MGTQAISIVETRGGASAIADNVVGGDMASGAATLGMATFGMATCPSTPRSSPASANSAGSTVTMAIAHSSSPVPATIPSSRKPPKSVASARKTRWPNRSRP